MLERVGAISIIAGTLLAIIAIAWLVLRLLLNRLRKSSHYRLRGPLLAFVVAILLTSGPIAVNSILTRLTSLGPLNKIVDGERHLTLTGWDQHDYSPIMAYTDTVVLQMANADVTDQTLTMIRKMKQLRELDLNHSQVTDAGLITIAELPRLQDLRLARTNVTDDGFRKHLLNKETLLNLDLTGTSIASKTVREWKAANPERKALK